MGPKFNWWLLVTLVGFVGGLVLLITNIIALVQLGDDLACICTSGNCICLGEGNPIMGSLAMGSVSPVSSTGSGSFLQDEKKIVIIIVAKNSFFISKI